MSPTELAGWNLHRELLKHPVITPELRQRWHTEMLELSQLRTMNMGVLAAALVFIERVRERISPDTFRSKILDDVLEQLTPDPIRPNDENYRNKNEERDIIITKLKASTLRYIVAVGTFRATA